MEPEDPQQRAPGERDAMPPGADAMPHEADPTPRDALRGLEERLDRASAAAQQLVRAAARQASAPGEAPQDRAASSRASSEAPSASSEAPPPDGSQRPPPAGWQTPPNHDRSAGTSVAGEIEMLLGVVKSVRELIPPELQRRLTHALRELLLAIQALIDWYLERLEQHPAEPAEVQDIPIL